MRSLLFRAHAARVLSPLLFATAALLAGCGIDSEGLLDAHDGGTAADTGPARADAGDAGDAGRPTPPPTSTDADGDGVADSADCAPADAHAWVTVDAYLDADGDGVGAGPLQSICGTTSAAPAGYSLVNTDCAPADAARYRLYDYAFRDADGDGRFVAEVGQACSGLQLPPGYSNAAMSSLDCDDTNPSAFTSISAYVDADGDGFGAGGPVTQCTNGTPMVGFALRDGDCDPLDSARYQRLPYAYRDADGDGVTVGELGELCTGAALPAGYSTTASGEDCNDHDPSASVVQVLYSDADGDGYGAGAAQSLCVGMTPTGYATRGDDCAPTDASAYQQLSYAYRDVDGDHYTVSASGVVCTGAALPAGYLSTADRGLDCDDTSAARFASVTVYADEDGDGDGAGAASVACTAGEAPAGFSLTATDCAPIDPALRVSVPYRYVDRDGDGATVAQAGTVCTNGTLPPPYFAAPRGLDCDDGDAAKTHFAVVFPDADGDGVGAGQYVIVCIGATTPIGYSPYGDDEDDGDPAKKDDPEIFESVLLPAVLASP